MSAASRKNDIAHCPSDEHGCPSCPHSVDGPATSGSPDVCFNGNGALRVGDRGRHTSCCGPNKWTVAGGAPAVFINGKAAARKGDPVDHCGGRGELIEGSDDVFIGNVVQLPAGKEQETWADAEMDDAPMG